MASISAFGVTQHRQIFSLFFRNRIQCVPDQIGTLSQVGTKRSQKEAGHLRTF